MENNKTPSRPNAKQDSNKDKYIKALVKRALGYEYEETTTLIEETKHGTKKKISKVTKHVPADVATAKYLLKKLQPTDQDYTKALKEFEEQLKETTYGNN